MELPILVQNYTEVQPAFTNGVPVVFCCDDNFAPCLFVAIISLIKNASPQNNYDILVFDGGISYLWKEKMLAFCSREQNISLRFVNTEVFHEKTQLLDTSTRFGEVAYYRLFVASVLNNYDKIIYIDCDLVLCADIAELFNVDLAENVVAAALAPGVALCSNPYNMKIVEHLRANLKMKNPRHYFNSGVLVMDLKKIRDENIEEKFLEIAKIYDAEMPDQNVLNACLEDRWLEVPQEWNFHVFMSPQKHFPENFQKEVKNIIENERFKIVHYVTTHKPCYCKDAPLADIFWNYAKENKELLKILEANLAKKIFAKNNVCYLEPEKFEFAEYVWNYRLKKAFPRPRILVKIASIFILNKNARKEWKKSHLRPRVKIMVKNPKVSKSSVGKIFNAIFPASRTKIENSERHILETLKKQNDQLKKEISALRERQNEIIQKLENSREQ